MGSTGVTVELRRTREKIGAMRFHMDVVNGDYGSGFGVVRRRIYLNVYVYWYRNIWWFKITNSLKKKY